MSSYLPPGWPAGVHPPDSEDFERTAQAWLLDVVPPDYRLHGVLRRYPLALAAMAVHHAQACVAGARDGYRTARTELSGALPAHALEAVLAAYRAEGRRLVATARAVDLVARALRGEVFTPRLEEGQPGRQAPVRPAQSRPEQSRAAQGRPAQGRSAATNGAHANTAPGGAAANGAAHGGARANGAPEDAAPPGAPRNDPPASAHANGTRTNGAAAGAPRNGGPKNKAPTAPKKKPGARRAASRADRPDQPTAARAAAG